jgi:hypothetical protein
MYLLLLPKHPLNQWERPINKIRYSKRCFVCIDFVNIFILQIRKEERKEEKDILSKLTIKLFGLFLNIEN